MENQNDLIPAWAQTIIDLADVLRDENEELKADNEALKKSAEEHVADPLFGKVNPATGVSSGIEQYIENRKHGLGELPGRDVDKDPHAERTRMNMVNGSKGDLQGKEV